MENQAADSTIKSFFSQDIGSDHMAQFPKGDNQNFFRFYFCYKTIQKGLLDRVNLLKSGALSPAWLSYEEY